MNKALLRKLNIRGNESKKLVLSSMYTSIVIYTWLIIHNIISVYQWVWQYKQANILSSYITAGRGRNNVDIKYTNYFSITGSRLAREWDDWMRPLNYWHSHNFIFYEQKPWWNFYSIFCYFTNLADRKWRPILKKNKSVFLESSR